MSTKYKLIYFHSRGYGELARLIFAQAGEQYEDCRLEVAEWESTLKSKSPTGNAPLLEVEGVLYCQHKAIGRYLAKQFGLAGKTPLEALRADMVVDTVTDCLKPLSAMIGEKDEAKKMALVKKMEEEQLPDSLQSLERMLIANNGGDGFFVGEEVTWADIYFTYFITYPPVFGAKIDWCKIPKLAALSERVNQLPRISAWIDKRPKTNN